jgi:hypothetical protein
MKNTMKLKSIKNGLLLLVAVAVIGACVDPSASEEKAEKAKLRQSYSNCINASEGAPDKLANCQAILEQLKTIKEHQAFAQKENVRVIDYQRCLTARKTGDGQAYAEDCGKIWQEIRANNSPTTTN